MCPDLDFELAKRVSSGQGPDDRPIGMFVGLLSVWRKGHLPRIQACASRPVPQGSRPLI